MAVPVVGKCIVLSLLLFFFYTSYGFRIRDVGQAGTVEQHSACILNSNKCPDLDTTTNQLTTSSSRKSRFDTGRVDSIGRIKTRAEDVHKVNIEIKENRWVNADESKRLEYDRVKLKVGYGKKSDNTDEDISDDDIEDGDEDVIIEDDDDDDDEEEEKFNAVIDEDTEDTVKLNDIDNDDSDDDDDDDDDDVEVVVEKNIQIDNEKKSEKMEKLLDESKWNVRGELKKIKKYDQEKDNDGDDINPKETISKRVDVKNISNKNVGHDERTKNENIKKEKNSDCEEENKLVDPERSDDDDDDNDDDGIDKNVSVLRKLEKVRLADKNRLKSIDEEIKNETWIKNVNEESRKIKREEKVTLKNEILMTSREEIERREKKFAPKKMEKTKEQVEKLADDPIKKSMLKSENKIVKKNMDVKSGEMKRKIEKQSETKLKKILDNDDTHKKIIEKKEKSKAPVKQSETLISLSKLNDEIQRLPNFIPNFTAVVNPVCQQHGKIFLRQLRGYKLWAFQMLDSTAKIPSGLLRGNINQLGDFDQCLSISARVKVDEKTVKVQGKYCLANIDLYSSIPEMKIPVNLIQSRNFLRGSMYDTGHFVPKFTTINWALCLPAACSATDAQITISNVLNYLNNTSGLKFIVDVDPNMCYTRQQTQNYSKETIGVLYFFAMIFCLVIIATARDFFSTTEVKENYSERIIMSFSLRRTIKILMKPNQVDSCDINCIHGIRSLTTIALYVGHKMIPLAGLPYSNRIVLTEMSNNPISCLLRASIVYTDSFLILSGVLSAFNMSRETEIRGEIRWFCRIVARFIRLTPVLLIVIFWYAYVMEHIGSGPQWHIIKENADLCKQNSWTNLLYIQNFFPFEEMCATHTHQLALDMQLSLFAPVLVFFLQVKPVIGVLLIFFIIQISATLRYFATVNNYLSVVIFHGMSVKHLYKTANLTYAVSIHRATPYLFGIGLGCLIHYTGKNIKIYRVFVILGWILALISGAWSIFSPWPMAKRDYIYDVENNAQYTVLGPITWALALCWIIFACFTDNGGIINRLLSSYWLTVFSRISYSVYLTQFAVFFYNLATTRYSSEFQIHRAIDIYEILTIIIISTILTLFFDIPMQEVKSVLMECTDINSIKSGICPKIELNDDDDNKNHKSGINDENLENNDSQCLKKKQNGEKIIVDADYNEKKYNDNYERRRSQSVQRYNVDVDSQFHRDTTPRSYWNDVQRERRSMSRPAESNFIQMNNEKDFVELKSDRSDEIKRERSGKLIRRTPVRLMSSGSEDELLQRRGKNPRRPIERPRVSDEEDWEHELRIRRQRFMERMASEVNFQQDDKLEKNNIEDDTMRRSSAEGKIALLTGTTECRGMDAWTVIRGPRISVVDGSSQELSDNEADPCYTSDYDQSDEENKINREISPNITKEEDEFGVNSKNMNINKLMTMDVRQSSQREENNMENVSHLSINITPVATTKLFKRESIIKSQASEEDPEYLLPERPKLVEQEQEHPFKKAWQMQKSRSEEDGSSSFIIRDVKNQQVESNQLENNELSSPPITSSQTFQLVVEEVDVDSQQIQREKNENDDEDDVNDNKHDSDDSKSSGYFLNGAELSKIDCLNENEMK